MSTYTRDDGYVLILININRPRIFLIVNVSNFREVFKNSDVEGSRVSILFKVRYFCLLYIYD